jgi:hypothetical protein
MLLSCSEDNNRKSETAEFLGKWKMIETLIDPGDGSGIYEPVSGEFILEFFTNGTVGTNYMLCTLNGTNTGNFTSAYFANEQYIQSQTCNANQDFQIYYQIEGENLILSYPCVEACLVKFIRID